MEDGAWGHAAEDASSQRRFASSLSTLLTSAPSSPSMYHPQIPAHQHLLLQVEGGLPVEALVLRLHVSEACEVIGVHE